LAPERLWGLVAIVVACVCGVGYWVALARGRKGAWAGHLRKATFHLGLFVCGLAVLLALPIFDFGAISTRNQLARLESGAVTADEFDFAALRWDFGEPGRRALARLTRSGNAKVAELAALAANQTRQTYRGDRTLRSEADIDVRVQPDDPALRKLVIDYLRTNRSECAEFCIALDLGPGDGGKRDVALVNASGYARVLLPDETPNVDSVRYQVPPKFGPASKVEIRTVEKRYIYVDGRPVAPPLDELEAEAPPR
jgi:hypothetical protein